MTFRCKPEYTPLIGRRAPALSVVSRGEKAPPTRPYFRYLSRWLTTDMKGR